MASTKSRRMKSMEQAKLGPERPRPRPVSTDTPGFLIRLVGRRQAKTLAERTNVRHRHD
jgi:hypothetical protein